MMNEDNSCRHLEVGRFVDKERVAYRAALSKALAAGDAAALEKVLAKAGLDEKLLKLPPPVPPSSYFFPFPEPFPPKPDPHDFMWEPDLMRLERFRVRESLGVFCKFGQSLSVAAATYFEEAAEGSAQSTEQSGKAASAQASAGQSTAGQPTFSRAACGYRSSFTVPAADHVITATVSSALNAYFGWVEANTHSTLGGSGGGGYARVAARASLSLSGGSETVTEGPVEILAGEVSGPDQIFFESGPAGMFADAKITLPSGGPYDVQVEERIELIAEASDGHAYIQGAFTWNPLGVDMLGDCTSIMHRWQSYAP